MAVGDLGRRAAKWAVGGLDAFSPHSRGIVVLIYHRIGGGTAGSVDLPLPQFQEHLEWLSRERAVVTLDAAVTALGDGPPPAPDPVVITFDDGTADFVELALPALAEHGMHVTLYLATAFVEGRPHPSGAPPLSWAALREALSTGLVTVGSHTHDHVLLDRCPVEVIEDDLHRSIELIRENLQVDPIHFAYPKALPGSGPARAAVRARFRSAAVAGTRPNLYGGTDPYLLNRSPIQTTDSARWFRRKVEGGMAVEDRLRAGVNRLRYRGVST